MKLQGLGWFKLKQRPHFRRTTIAPKFPSCLGFPMSNATRNQRILLCEFFKGTTVD